MGNHLITVFTPTFNRKELLSRLYVLLQKQTFKDFLWLVIDDGSSDGTGDLVKEWISEELLDIKYIYKENGGKHKAFQIAYQICDTKYITDFDDDDIYFENCLEVFIDTWAEIEKFGLNNIGSIRALTIGSDGKVVGEPGFNITGGYKDVNYLQYQFCGGIKFENVSCIRMDAYRKTNFFYFDEFFLGEKVSFVYEDVFWARFAKKYDSRYLFIPVREYYNSPISITRGTKNKKRTWLSRAYSMSLILNEFAYLYNDCLFDFMKRHILYLTYVMAIGHNFTEGLNQLKSKRLRFISYFLYPLSKILSVYLTKFKYK